jgi:hypothetical protein
MVLGAGGYRRFEIPSGKAEGLPVGERLVVDTRASRLA